MKKILIICFFWCLPAYANGPWTLYACLPGYGPEGCIPIKKPATRQLCIEEMDNLIKSQKKGTIVGCINDAGELLRLPYRNR